MQEQARTVKGSAVSQNLSNPYPYTVSEDGAGVGGTVEGKPHEEKQQIHAVMQLSLLSCM